MRQFALLWREGLMANTHQRSGELADRVHRTRHGTMATWIGGSQLEISIGFFRALPVELARLTGLLVKHAGAAVDIEHQFRVGEFLGDDLAGLHRRFLVARKLDDDGAAWTIPFAL